MSCGAENEANDLFESLTNGEDFEIPNPDLSGPEFDIPEGDPIGGTVTRLTNDDLTDGSVAGNGTFDALMRGFKAHLLVEYEKGRISGAEYSKTYTALVEAAMANATSFLLGRDQAYWNAITAQQAARTAEIQVVIARTQLETAKVQLQTLRVEGNIAKANYALTKMKLSTESVQYCLGKFNLEYILPKQLILTSEQVESQRAQTLNTRTDGAQVAGLLGKQKELYSQQITSYQRDAEFKAAKIFADAWTVQKTIDEGLVPPPSFNNASVDQVLAKIKLNNGLT